MIVGVEAEMEMTKFLVYKYVVFDFTDVTLVCEDWGYLLIHQLWMKVVESGESGVDGHG